MPNFDTYFEDFKNIIDREGDQLTKLADSHILITGATGLVGACTTCLFLYLAQKGFPIRITIVTRDQNKAKRLFGPYINESLLEVIETNITEGLNAADRYSHIIHAAAVTNPKLYYSQPAETICSILEGTKSILELARSAASKVVFLSSVEVYGRIKMNGHEKNDEHHFGPIDCLDRRSCYAEAKRLTEALCLAYCVEHGLNVSIARLAKVYGPFNSPGDTRIMAHMLACICNGLDIELRSDGKRIFSFCYVTDAASAILSILLHGKPGEAYNVADAHSIASLRDVALMCSSLTGVAARFGKTDLNPGVSSDTVVSSDRLEALGWHALTDIKSGLQKQYRATRIR